MILKLYNVVAIHPVQVSEMKPVYPAPGMPAAGGGGILYGEHVKLEHCETKYR
jgi:hypothetical protein